VFALGLAAASLLPSAIGKDAFPDPPAHPDKIHVSNGCQLSTVRYLAQFKSEYPGETGEVLEISLPEADRNHAVALISWHGQLWCRDEYFGVFPLECAAEPRPRPEALADRAESMLRRQAARLIHRDGARTVHPSEGPMSPDQRLAEVIRARLIIPFRSTLFWIRDGGHEIPVIFFRLTSDWIAVYDPPNGTCLARCESLDVPAVVSRVAEKLGYAVDGIRTM
jgi:hypothetical protein